MKGALVNAVVALAAFLATCGALHVCLPSPQVRDVSAKLRFFGLHKDEFDTVFLGSSHIHYGVAPSVFDEVLAGAGIQSRTFNLGIDGMCPPEQFYVLDQILAAKPHKLKRLFLEMENIEETWRPDERISQRAVYWHDWKRTRIVLRKVLNADVHESWKRKWHALRRGRGTIAVQLTLFARNVCNVGRAFDLAESFGPNDDYSEWNLGPKLDGYIPLVTSIFTEKAAGLEKDLAHEISASLENVVIDRYAAGAYRDYARQIRAVGATPILLVTPGHPQLPSKFPGAAPSLLLAYNDPIRYPDLYRFDARMDEYHLNPMGADRFTRLIAEDFLKNRQRP